MECDHPLLWCACRHHIFELIAKAVWKVMFPGDSVCPGEKLIQDFHKWWNGTASFPRHFTASDRPFLVEDGGLFADAIEDLRRLSSATRAAGKSSFQRGDYDELLELFEVPNCNFKGVVKNLMIS